MNTRLAGVGVACALLLAACGSSPSKQSFYTLSVNQGVSSRSDPLISPVRRPVPSFRRRPRAVPRAALLFWPA